MKEGKEDITDKVQEGNSCNNVRQNTLQGKKDNKKSHEEKG